MKKLLIGLAALVLVLMGALAIMTGKPPPLPPLPQPNGYDDFVKAGRVVVSAQNDNPADLELEELRARVTANREALRLARAGLQRECRVVLDFSTNNLANHVAQMGTFKALTRAFLAEGSLSERENRPGDAARAYLDAIRFGHEGFRGGVVIDMLVGLACRSLGCRSLERMLDKLTVAECQESIRQLKDMEAKAEALDTVFKQERFWARHTYGLKGQIQLLITRSSLARTQQQFRAKYERQQQEIRQLLRDLTDRVNRQESPAKR